MRSTAQAQLSVRERAIRLMEEFFAPIDDAATRRLIFQRAFEGCQPSPVRGIKFDPALAVFAAEVSDHLLAFGGLGRGKHALSRLIETMASERGRQSNPDFHDLPLLLDEQCN